MSPPSLMVMRGGFLPMLLLQPAHCWDFAINFHTFDITCPFGLTDVEIFGGKPGLQSADVLLLLLQFLQSLCRGLARKEIVIEILAQGFQRDRLDRHCHQLTNDKFSAVAAREP